MKTFFYPKAEGDLSKMDGTLRSLFIEHSEKLLDITPRRHLKYDVPYFVEKVTKQARLVYEIQGELLCVVRCFATHKEYEHWLNGFR